MTFSPEALNRLARRIGALYDMALRTPCDKGGCKHMVDGRCQRNGALRELADVVWEAKEGRTERLDALAARLENWDREDPFELFEEGKE